MKRKAVSRELGFWRGVFSRYAMAVVAVGAAFLLRQAFSRHFGSGLTYITFSPAVMLVAVFGGFGPALFATVLSALAAAVWILPPAGFAITKPSDVIGLVLFLAMGVVMSAVAGMYHRARSNAAGYENALLLLESQEALSRSERNATAILNATTESVWMFDTQGRVLSANDTGARRLGKSVAEVLGKYMRDLIPPHLAESRMARIDEVVRTGQPVRFEDERAHFTFDHSFYPINDSMGKTTGVAVFSHDISDSKQAAEELLEINKRLDLISDTASRLLQTDDPQGLVQSLCEKAMDVLDCQVFFNFLVDDERGCLHLNAFAGVPDEIGKSIEWLDYGVAVCGCAARDGCRIVAEDILNTPDPRTELVKSFGMQAYACHPLVAEGGRVIGTLSFGSRDKTSFAPDELDLMKAIADQVATAMERVRLLDEARMRAQELAESEQQFRTMANAIPQLAWMAEPDGFIFWYNERWYQYTGTTPEQMEGWGWQSVHDPAALPKVLERWKESLATGEPFSMEFPLLGADGKFRPFLTRGVPMKDAEGNVLRWFGTNTDVSEQREFDAHKREFYRETILAATEGKLRISESNEIEGIAGDLLGEWEINGLEDVGKVRTATSNLAREAGMDESRVYEFMGCVVESAGNAAKHADGGRASLYRRDDSLLFVIADHGPGIGAMRLPDVALTRGYTTAGTLGMGYKVMIKFADRVYLATGPDGTTVASEMSLHADGAAQGDALVSAAASWA